MTSGMGQIKSLFEKVRPIALRSQTTFSQMSAFQTGSKRTFIPSREESTLKHITGILLLGLLIIVSSMISGCGSTGQQTGSTLGSDQPTIEASTITPNQPTVEPTLEITIEPTIEPTIVATRPSPTHQPQQSAVPSRLIGTWNGGSNYAPEGYWYYTFYANGEYQRYNSQIGTFTGDFVVNGDQISFYGTQPFTATWSITYDELIGDILFLDGYSYVRA
jgi:hypothetical protein